jgi:hypothetical protein
MRKVNLVDYEVKKKAIDPANLEKFTEYSLTYPVKDTILNLMFTRELQLTSAELVKQNALALKIEACKEPVITIEDAEWERLKRAIEAFKGFSRDDTELVSRILEAEKT